MLNTNTETATNEFDLNIDDLSSFIDVSEKDYTVNYDNTTALHSSKENNSTVNHTKEIKFILKT